MPYTYTELDLGVSQDVLQVCHKMCHKCVARCVTSVLQDVSQACETPFIPHVSPNSVHS